MCRVPPMSGRRQRSRAHGGGVALPSAAAAAAAAAADAAVAKAYAAARGSRPGPLLAPPRGGAPAAPRPQRVPEGSPRGPPRAEDRRLRGCTIAMRSSKQSLGRIDYSVGWLHGDSDPQRSSPLPPRPPTAPRAPRRRRAPRGAPPTRFEPPPGRDRVRGPPTDPLGGGTVRCCVTS
jgi:hypothetical protein